MNCVICCVGIGGWYPRGVARLVNAFADVSPGFTVKAWVNTLPFGAPANVVENGYDYTAYCAKPFALLEAMTSGADMAILVDAAFYPVRPIHELVDHIARHGYYFCKNGNLVGEWASDRCLDKTGTTREDAFTMEEISSYCVGLNFYHGQAYELLWRWCGFAADRLTFPGYHTNLIHQRHKLDTGQELYRGRNVGVVSTDNRVKGHRHDQTVLSILAHRMGMKDLVERPRFTAYLGHETEQTVLVNHGGF